MTYLECWVQSASALFSQALAGEPSLVEAGGGEEERDSGEVPECFAFVATLAGNPEGRFLVMVERAVLDVPLLGEGVDQLAGWSELLREAADAAVGELLARTGEKCRVAGFEPAGMEAKATMAFHLRSGGREWAVRVREDVKTAARAATEERKAPDPAAPSVEARPSAAPAVSPGIELLMDVELEATLRFGCRELPLGEILSLGPGDVVQLDRHISDPADLIVGDKIVARGEVVLVNGNFGLRVTDVAEPRRRLESIRCLF